MHCEVTPAQIPDNADRILYAGRHEGAPRTIEDIRAMLTDWELALMEAGRLGITTTYGTARWFHHGSLFCHDITHTDAIVCATKS